jgi:inositol transporter-like SP family MFS transporter
MSEHHWRNTVLAGLANSIDAGSSVSGSPALALSMEQNYLTPSFIGLLGAFGANALSTGVGALIGGRLCDGFGRKLSVPVLAATGFRKLAWILTSFPIASGLVGLLSAPRHEGKSLSELERRVS